MDSYKFSDYISNIFNDNEISTSFENAFIKNTEIMLNWIEEIIQFISSKSHHPKFKDPNTILMNFKEHTLQPNIIWLSLNEVFKHQKFDLKSNILETINSNYIQKCYKVLILEEFIDSIKYSSELTEKQQEVLLQDISKKFEPLK